MSLTGYDAPIKKLNEYYDYLYYNYVLSHCNDSSPNDKSKIWFTNLNINTNTNTSFSFKFDDIECFMEHRLDPLEFVISLEKKTQKTSIETLKRVQTLSKTHYMIYETKNNAHSLKQGHRNDDLHEALSRYILHLLPISNSEPYITYSVIKSNFSSMDWTITCSLHPNLPLDLRTALAHSRFEYILRTGFEFCSRF